MKRHYKASKAKTDELNIINSFFLIIKNNKNIYHH